MNGNLQGLSDTERAARVEITGLAADSRAVAPGALFAALPGSRADGAAFIPDAVRRGAVAVLAPPGAPLPAGCESAILVTDPEPRRRLALMAARFYGAQPRTVVAVTGTNGKTSTVRFLRQIWTRLGHRAASLGTLGLDSPDVAPAEPADAGPALTTVDPVALHRTLARLAEGGVDHLAMEASSHGLAQHRLDGVRLAAAGLTNISRDHLDHHGSMAAYRAAKTRLFGEVLRDGGTAVLNADRPEFTALAEICAARGIAVLSYGRKGRDLRLADLAPAAGGGQRLTIEIAGRTHRIDLPLAGDFQAANALCALGLALACGAEAEAAIAALAGLTGVPGRLEAVGATAEGAAVYVDYAHTPDALAHLLRALRPHARGRLAVLFGCGGDRDPGKRPEMGAIARDLADAVYVTDDNPRGEEPAAIRKAILAACPGAVEIGDRRLAIETAIAGLGADDLLVIAGKGHETGQIVGDKTLPFDDRAVARAVLAGRDAGVPS